MVTRRGTESAVLVPVSDWQRLQSAGWPTLKALLLSNEASAELTVPPRSYAQRRPVNSLD
jgi:PHD/YefM family antitoxin component YafN of YafNO toxin-antitoxin module